MNPKMNRKKKRPAQTSWGDWIQRRCEEWLGENNNAIGVTGRKSEPDPRRRGQLTTEAESELISQCMNGGR